MVALGSQTSTVLPAQKLPKDCLLVSLAGLPKTIEFDNKTKSVTVSGPVTWEELNLNLSGHSRMLASAPTTKLATVLAGLATSCTGENSFRFKTLREQVEWIEFIGHNGEKQRFFSNKTKEISVLENYPEYRESMAGYRGFKNAPFPLIYCDTDLLIGSEGQLGIITSACFKTVEKESTNFLLFPTKNWKTNLEDLMIRREQLLAFKDWMISFEFFDRACITLIGANDLKIQDYIAVEIPSERLDSFFQVVTKKIPAGELEQVIVLPEKNWHELRVRIPNQIAEELARKNLVKRGTDIQASEERLIKLLQLYQEMTGLAESTYLFGHFGDGHLHFNFLPTLEEQASVEAGLSQLYENLATLGGFSPFAEHGIGLLKQEFVQNFWYDAQYKLFKEMKLKFDPMGVFFPKGYMGLKPSL